jgi:hypothetical protein
MKVKCFNTNILNIKLGQCYEYYESNIDLMESKVSFVLLKFLQSINMKKNNMNINHIY